MSLNDLQFMTNLYSKFDELGNGTEVKNLIQDNNTDNNIIDNIKNNRNINYEDYKNINYEDYKNNRNTEITETFNKNNGYDFLLEDTNIQNKTKIKQNKKKESKYIYIFMLIIFSILNSYYVINLINSNNIPYNISLLIRGIVFILLYWIYKKID
jgi:hypothetical protein